MLGLFRRQSEVDIGEARRFLESEFRGDIDSESGRLSRIEDEISGASEGLKKSVQELDSIESSNSFTGSLKSRYCRKAMNAIENMKKPPGGYESKKEFSDSCAAVVKEISDIDIREFRHLGAFSIKMSKISSQISQINRLCSSYASLLSNSRTGDACAAGLMSKSIKLKSEGIVAMKNEAESLKSSYDFLKSRIHSIALESSEIREKIEDIEGTKSGMSESEKQKISIETALSTEFGSLERIIRKFMHDCEDLVEKNDIETMKRYINDAGDAFLHHDDGSVLMRNLIKMRDAITSGNFSCDEKTEKIDRSIRSMDFFISMKERRAGICADLDRFHKKIDDSKKPLFRRKEVIENEVEKLNLDARHALEGYEKKSAEMAEMRKSLASDIENMKSWLSKKCGRRIILKHDSIP